MAKLAIRQNVSLAAFSTLKVGGRAQYLVVVKNVDELQQAVEHARTHALPFLCVGGGSNLLFDDAGYLGLVIVIRISGRTYDLEPDGTVLAGLGAGEVFDEVVADTVSRGWWGLENLSHIPGTVGATPVQNVGAYGVEMSDIITAVEVFDTNKMESRTLTPAECQFGYRDSIFKTKAGKNLIVTHVQCRLTTKSQPQVGYVDLVDLGAQAGQLTSAQVREAVVAVRARKFPDWTKVGTAGSFFTNPIITNAQAKELQVRYPDLPVYKVSSSHSKIALGYVLDKVCRLKGYRLGEVMLSPAQALVLIAYEGATASEILTFSDEIAKRVYKETGLNITREVTYVAPKN